MPKGIIINFHSKMGQDKICSHRHAKLERDVNITPPGEYVPDFAMTETSYVSAALCPRNRCRSD